MTRGKGSTTLSKIQNAFAESNMDGDDIEVGDFVQYMHNRKGIVIEERGAGVVRVYWFASDTIGGSHTRALTRITKDEAVA